MDYIFWATLIAFYLAPMIAALNLIIWSDNGADLYKYDIKPVQMIKINMRFFPIGMADKEKGIRGKTLIYRNILALLIILIGIAGHMIVLFSGATDPFLLNVYVASILISIFLFCVSYWIFPMTTPKDMSAIEAAKKTYLKNFKDLLSTIDTELAVKDIFRKTSKSPLLPYRKIFLWNNNIELLYVVRYSKVGFLNVSASVNMDGNLVSYDEWCQSQEIEVVVIDVTNRNELLANISRQINQVFAARETSDA